MSETKHTPGPWSVGVTSDGGEIDIIAADGWFVSVACDSVGEGDTEANAHLIAAAPDMLEALELAVAIGIVPVTSASEGGAAKFSEHVRVADMIRAAIKKARGEL